ncbi:MAG TPA: tRNA (adenosine(37)-N6)-threonylcarbamoyltransferase complex dimerization subunit type 1 TsaB [Bacteroidales bacterium]|nr:tRNA (adenosine(37)-N6)-threonylcarbamoyltransferase complex dimerization subunit type 1 TsaB [Bacteroidales bacterium]
MALILNIETSTQVCSVCLSDGGKVIAMRESNDDKSHARLLNLFIEEILKENKLNFGQLDAVAVSKGPGSYTGLRIGVSTAKGLCYAKNIPLIAVHTLESMAYGVIHYKYSKSKASDSDIVFVPMIDARRMEVYSAFFNIKGEMIREVEAEIIDENSYQDILKDKKMVFFGDGSDKIKDVLKNPNAMFIENVNPSSEYMSALSESAFNKKQFEDIAYFEPFYLKDFIATIPKKNIFK